MATIGTRLHTWLRGILVGQDSFGNRYYEARKTDHTLGRKRRWVMYNGTVEPSKIPAHWHGWMHYTTNDLPSEHDAQQHSWQKPHQPNLTGTAGRYLPPGHLLKGGNRAKSASGDYEAWTP